MKTLIYLATPYSHPDPDVRVARFNAVNKVAANLMSAGWHIYSPISHTHPIAIAGELPTGWEYWQAYDEAILKECRELRVLMLPGWEQSKGVAGEVAIAQRLGIPTSYLEPSEFEL
jgi:hypothetical protein